MSWNTPATLDKAKTGEYVILSIAPIASRRKACVRYAKWVPEQKIWRSAIAGSYYWDNEIWGWLPVPEPVTVCP